jgi:hypothetical protein
VQPYHTDHKLARESNRDVFPNGFRLTADQRSFEQKIIDVQESCKGEIAELRDRLFKESRQRAQIVQRLEELLAAEQKRSDELRRLIEALTVALSQSQRETRTLLAEERFTRKRMDDYLEMNLRAHGEALIAAQQEHEQKQTVSAEDVAKAERRAEADMLQTVAAERKRSKAHVINAMAALKRQIGQSQAGSADAGEADAAVPRAPRQHSGEDSERPARKKNRGKK